MGDFKNVLQLNCLFRSATLTLIAVEPKQKLFQMPHTPALYFERLLNASHNVSEWGVYKRLSFGYTANCLTSVIARELIRCLLLQRGIVLLHEVFSLFEYFMLVSFLRARLLCQGPVHHRSFTYFVPTLHFLMNMKLNAPSQTYL